MKFRRFKGFSLAEILIVMTVIGVIATLTMPQLIGGVDEAHYKAGFKKAYSTIANVSAILKSDDELPTGTTDALYKEAALNVFRGICDNVEVEGVAANTHTINAAAKLASTSIFPGTTYESIPCGESTGLTAQTYTKDKWSPWIIAADGMAFAVNKGSGCGTKADINAPNVSAATALTKSCVLVVVDVNGLERLPNKLEPQVAGFSSGAKLKKLTGDRYYIYITKNGIAKGAEDTTISGRLIAGQK